MSVHLPSMPMGTNPGGLWVRICVGEELILQRALGLDHLIGFGAGASEGDYLTPIGVLGEADAVATVEACWRLRCEGRCYIYDGDDGHCVCTLIVPAPPEDQQEYVPL